MSIETAHRRMNPSLLGHVSRGLLRLFSTDITLRGEANIPTNGPAIVVTNHMGILEVLPPFAYLPESPFAFSKKENLDLPLLGSLFRKLGTIPVRRGEVDRSAIRAATTVLVNQNAFLFTCPEGTRGRDIDCDRTVLKPAKGGIIYIAQLAANELQQPIPISPWAIWGTEGVLPEVDEPGTFKQRFAVHRDHVYITVGEPYVISPSDQRQTKEGMQTHIDSVMGRIRDMLPRKYHGYYAK